MFIFPTFFYVTCYVLFSAYIYSPDDTALNFVFPEHKGFLLNCFNISFLV